MAFSGGQYFWPDEQRYTRAIGWVADLDSGRFGDAARLLASNADHTGFTLVGGLSVVLARAVAAILPGLATSDALTHLQTSVLSASGVCSIGLIYAIARKLGASGAESLLAALFMATANTLFYFARHLLPYDAALALLLAGLWIGIAPRQATFWRSFGQALLTGGVIGCGVLTYNGYWLLAALIGVLCWTYAARTPSDLMRRGVGLALGAALPMLALMLLAARFGIPYLKNLLDFNTTILQGDFSEGAALPWVYLWEAERLTLIVWAIGIGGLVVRFAQARRVGIGGWWVGAALAVYVALALGSSGLHKFVVYGRLARQVVPFLCLAAAAGYKAAGLRVFSRVGLVGLVVLGVCAAPNFAAVFGLAPFPDAALADAIGAYGPVNRSVTAGIRTPAPEPTWPNAAYTIVNAAFVYPFEAPITPPDGQLVRRSPYPLSYAPYQFEGADPAQRAIINGTDLSVAVIRLAFDPVGVRFGDALRLEKINPPRDRRATPCDVLHVDGWWHTLRPISGTVTLTLRLTDAAGQRLDAERPLIGAGKHQANGDERWVDQYYVPLPCSLAVGRATLSAALNGAADVLADIPPDPAPILTLDIVPTTQR